MGYTRILGELKKIGIESVTRNTVKNILKRNGYETGPKRGPGDGMTFSNVKPRPCGSVTSFPRKSSLQQGFATCLRLVFLHVETRRVFISPSTYNPDEAWVLKQGEAFKKHLKDEKHVLQNIDA